MDEGGRLPKVTNIAPQHRALEAPSFLRKLQGWLIWRYEHHAGEPKPRKVPYYVEGGRRQGAQGSQSDRAKLTTFAAARDAAARKGFDGVGFAMLPDWGITALDFDKCVDDRGNIPDEIMDIVSRTYAEYSPSGEGVRAFINGNLGNHKDIAKAGQYGFETFNTNGFVTFTGNLLPICELMGFDDVCAEADDRVRALADARFGTHQPSVVDPDDFMAGREPRLGLSLEEIEALLDKLDPDMDRDGWVRVGMAVHHETEGGDDGFWLWNAWSENGHKYPSEMALQQQWDSFTRRQGDTRKQVTMASVIKMAREMGNVATSDMLAAAAAEGAQIAEAHSGLGVRTPESFSGKFPVVSAGELTRRPPGDWLIKGIVPKADLVILYGASGSGKSFVGIDLLASIARGVPWRGHKSRKGRALIIAAEGGSGVGKRFEAYCLHHHLDPDELDIGLIIAPPDFMNKDDISELVKSVAAVGGADIIMVDTLAQVTPGVNENAGEDMGRVLANARALGDATGAVIMPVHHAGKDLHRGSRGWSGIKAAADAEIEVIKHENGGREIRISKMKDGDDGLSWGFKLEVLELGLDGDGDTITSCVAVEAEVPKPESEESERNNVARYGPIERHLLEIIQTVDQSLEKMPLYELLDIAIAALPKPEDGKRDTRRQRVQRAVAGLSKRKDGPFEIRGGLVIFNE